MLNATGFNPLLSGNVQSYEHDLEFDMGDKDVLQPIESISNAGLPDASFLLKSAQQRAQSTVSGITSNTSKSTASRAKVEAAARQAELKVKAEVLKRKHELENEIQLIPRIKEQLELEAEIAATSARLAAINQVEASQVQAQMTATQGQMNGCTSPPSGAHEKTLDQQAQASI